MLNLFTTLPDKIWDKETSGVWETSTVSVLIFQGPVASLTTPCLQSTLPTPTHGLAKNSKYFHPLLRQVAHHKLLCPEENMTLT